jgi:hypothetical protein
VPRTTKARAKYSALSRYRDASDPELLAAKAELNAAVIEANQRGREARLRELIKEQVEAEPPLTQDQRNRLAVLLRAGERDDIGG